MLQSFEDLALRVNLDDRIQVRDQSDVTVTGRLIGLTREELVIQTSTGEQRLTRDAVRAVAVRGHALRKGALLGAGVVAVLGAVATCVHEGGRDCLLIGTLGAPIGAGVGLAVGALVPQMTPVYRTPQDRIPVQPSRGVSGVQARFPEDLALRINLDDHLRVEDQSGQRTTGRLTRLTAQGVTLQTAAGEKHFTPEAVRQVAVRRRPLRMTVLVGAGAGAVAGAFAACTGPDREECADAPIMAGALGAGLGLAAGALIHTSTVVYPEPARRTFIVPAISRDAVGVQVRRRW